MEGFSDRVEGFSGREKGKSSDVKVEDSGGESGDRLHTCICSPSRGHASLSVI